MEFAYLLINCEYKRDSDVASELEKLYNVKDVRRVFGAYDLVAKVEGESKSSIMSNVTRKIRDLANIRSVICLTTKA